MRGVLRWFMGCLTDSLARKLGQASTRVAQSFCAWSVSPSWRAPNWLYGRSPRIILPGAPRNYFGRCEPLSPDAEGSRTVFCTSEHPQTVSLLLVRNLAPGLAPSEKPSRTIREPLAFFHFTRPNQDFGTNQPSSHREEATGTPPLHPLAAGVGWQLFKGPPGNNFLASYFAPRAPT